MRCESGYCTATQAGSLKPAADPWALSLHSLMLAGPTQCLWLGYGMPAQTSKSPTTMGQLSDSSLGDIDCAEHPPPALKG